MGFRQIPLRGSWRIARRIISQGFRFVTSLGFSHKFTTFFSVFWIFYLNYGDLVKFLQNEDFCIFTFKRRFDEFYLRCSAVKSGRDTAFTKKISFSSFLHFSPKIWGFGKIPLQGSWRTTWRIISQVLRFLTSLGLSH